MNFVIQYPLKNNKVQFLIQYNSNNKYNIIIFNPFTTSILTMKINFVECYDSFKEKSQL